MIITCCYHVSVMASAVVSLGFVCFGFGKWTFLCTASAIFSECTLACMCVIISAQYSRLDLCQKKNIYSRLDPSGLSRLDLYQSLIME
jgi:hypothetical protein